MMQNAVKYLTPWVVGVLSDYDATRSHLRFQTGQFPTRMIAMTKSGITA
jgi:hypothetical protein